MLTRTFFKISFSHFALPTGNTQTQLRNPNVKKAAEVKSQSDQLVTEVSCMKNSLLTCSIICCFFKNFRPSGLIHKCTDIPFSPTYGFL